MQCIGRIYFYAHYIYCLFYCTWSKCSIVFFFIRIGATPNIARIARSSNTCNASISWQTWPSQLHQDDLSECGRIRVLPRLDTDDLPVSLTETDRWTNVGGRSTSANRRLHMFAHVIQYNGFLIFLYAERDVFPYGIYMLAYEYLYRKIDNSRWMMDQRTLSFSKGKCIEMLIPIVAGATAGMFLFCK